MAYVVNLRNGLKDRFIHEIVLDYPKNVWLQAVSFALHLVLVSYAMDLYTKLAVGKRAERVIRCS